METYSVENIQDNNTWVVKDASNKIVASFSEGTTCKASWEAENYAQRLNKDIDVGKYRAISSALNRVYDKAVRIQDIIKIIHDNIGDAKCKDKVEEMLGLIPESVAEFEQAVAALPSVKDFDKLLAITARTPLVALRGY